MKVIERSEILTSILHLTGDFVSLLLVNLDLRLRGGTALLGCLLRDNLDRNITDYRILKDRYFDCLACEGKRSCLLIDVYNHLIVYFS